MKTEKKVTSIRLSVELIKKLNGGVVDTKFPINWQHYRNCVLLTQHGDLKQLNTKIHDIINLS